MPQDKTDLTSGGERQRPYSSDEIRTDSAFEDRPIVGHGMVLHWFLLWWLFNQMIRATEVAIML